MKLPNFNTLKEDSIHDTLKNKITERRTVKWANHDNCDGMEKIPVTINGMINDSHLLH